MMLNPDEIPLHIAVPLIITLCIIWRRQTVVARRKR